VRVRKGIPPIGIPAGMGIGRSGPVLCSESDDFVDFSVFADPDSFSNRLSSYRIGAKLTNLGSFGGIDRRPLSRRLSTATPCRDPRMTLFRRRILSNRPRRLRCETLQRREMLAGDTGGLLPAEQVFDVNRDGIVTARDALVVVNLLNERNASGASGEPITNLFADVSGDGHVTAVDALQIINHLNGEPRATLAVEAAAMMTLSNAEVAAIAKDASVTSGVFASAFSAIESTDDAGTMPNPENLLTKDDVDALLKRASEATSSEDAIIAVVDRSGRILGVRVEAGVSATLQADDTQFAFAIDGAVAKARTAAFFSSNAAPLTSRTIRFISQSTVTQREVESSPTDSDPLHRGPGFVAPIGVGGQFPPEIPFTPQVDLFAIEHQSRDSQTHPGEDGLRGTDDDFELQQRFNANPAFVPAVADQFFRTWPESFGEQSGMDPDAVPRGIATLPGGIPLFKLASTGVPNLVGGIGVFFPGEDGYATHEQGFEFGQGQTEKQRTNADKVLEAEFAAFAASAGGGIVAKQSAFFRDISDLNAGLTKLPNFVALSSRIDLVGLTLEIYGPTPTREHRVPGIDRLLSFGRGLGTSTASGDLIDVGFTDAEIAGQAVPEEWLVVPQDSPTDPELTAEVVEQIIRNGIQEADRTRAAIRLTPNLTPGALTRMVLAVADKQGELLGLYRMPDATIFSIDVAIAKARNTAYYADAEDIQDADIVDFNGDGTFGVVSGSLKTRSGDTLPKGTALTNRSFRFLAGPQFPTGTELDRSLASGCDASPTPCLEVGPHSMLRLPGINPLTGENLGDGTPMAFEVYASATHSSTKAYDAFNVMRNFRDVGDAEVIVHGTDLSKPLANQNGVVFFPGSTPIYIHGKLVGGFGVSGDGVDQDDVVTSAGQQGFAPPVELRVDAYTLGGVRVPFQKFNRNPFSD